MWEAWETLRNPPESTTLQRSSKNIQRIVLKRRETCHWTNWSRKFTFTLLGAHRLWRRLHVCPCCCNWPSPMWGGIHDPWGHVISKPFIGNQGKVIIYLVQSFSLVTIDLKAWPQHSLNEEAISKTSKIFEVWRTQRAGENNMFKLRQRLCLMLMP